jgi:hypothetical protein
LEAFRDRMLRHGLVVQVEPFEMPAPQASLHIEEAAPKAPSHSAAKPKGRPARRGVFFSLFTHS